MQFLKRVLPLLFLIFASQLVKATQVQDTSRIKSILEQSWAIMYQNPDSALTLCHEALGIATQNDLQSHAAKSMNQIGVVHWVTTEFDSSLFWLERAFEAYAELEDEMGMGTVSNNFGLTYMSMDFYELAMRSFQDALPVVQKSGRPARLATLYNNLGMVTHAVRDYETSFDYFMEALKIVRELPDQRDTARLNNNIGLSLRDAGHLERAEFFHKNAVAGYREQNNPRELVQALYNCGGLYALMDSFKKADSIYQEALVLAEEIEIPYHISSVWLKIAELRVREERYSEAVAAADSTLAYLESGQGLKPWVAIYEVLSVAESKLGNFEAAFDYAQKINVLGDSMLSTETARNIEELTLKYETELKDKEIANLQQQEELSRWQKWGLTVIIGLVLVIFAIVFNRQRRIIQREKQLQEKTREAAVAMEALRNSELRAAELSKQKLEEEVRHKSSELSSLALGIIRHHDLLQNLDQGLKSLRSKVQSEVRDEVQQLAVIVNNQLGVEKERQDLQLYIDEVEQRFFQLLDEKYPGLTKRERRLCALIRMGYSSKEIAAIFNINPTSVDQGRYRLRKKLDPEMQVNLNEFLENLSKA